MPLGYPGHLCTHNAGHRLRPKSQGLFCLNGPSGSILMYVWCSYISAVVNHRGLITRRMPTHVRKIVRPYQILIFATF